MHRHDLFVSRCTTNGTSMNPSEILRKFADIIDNANGTQPKGQLAVVNVPDMHDSPEQELDPDPKMIPPLQQNLELLKKSLGVESEYDEECGCEEPEDELHALLRVAGINVITPNDV